MVNNYILQEYFDDNIDMIEQQLCWCGRLDKYFWSFHTNYVSKIMPDTMMDALFECNTLEEQRTAFNKLPLAEFEKTLKYVVITIQAKEYRLHTCIF